MIPSIRAWTLRRKGMKGLNRGDYEQAIESFKELLEFEPYERTNRYIGLAYMGAGRYKESESYLTENLERYGENYTRLRALADLYYVWGKRKSAQKHYRKALGEGPGNAERLVEERIRYTENPEAFEAVRKADEAYHAGTVAFRDRDPETALESFREATRLDPTNVLAWNNVGAVLLNHYKDYDGAEEAFNLS